MKKLILFLMLFTSITFAGWEVVEDEMHLLSPDGSELLTIFRDIDNQNVVMDWTLGDLIMLGGDVNLTIDNLDTTGTLTAGDIIVNSLTADSGVYTDSLKKLVSTPPTSGILGYWSRTGTVITSANIGDDLTLTGNLTLPDGGTISALGGLGTDLITLDGTLGEVTVDGDFVADNLTVPTTTSLLGHIYQGLVRYHSYGSRNLFIGEGAGNFALTSNSTDNIGIGFNALMALDGSSSGKGVYNVAIGTSAGSMITDGLSNMLIGRRSGTAITTGSLNVGVGENALNSLTTGTSNMAIGKGALGKITAAVNNVAIGTSALSEGTSGNSNVGIGWGSGLFNSGSQNLFLGYRAGLRQTAASNTLILDTQSRASAAAEATDSIIFGTMASTPAAQSLRLNAVTNVTQKQRIGDTTAPTYALEVAGVVKSESGRIKNTSRYTATQTILVTDDQVYCNGTFTVTLPTGVDGQTFRIINSGTGTITITSAENILGSTEDVRLNAGDVVILTFETSEKWW